MKNIFTLFLLLFVSGNILAQNCSVTGPIVITPQGTTEITFEVSGLVNDDLSTTQGLCLVELGFRHNSVSNLEVEIISPAGDVVQLIGPGNVNSLGSTQFINWDVTFAATSYPAQPDDAFANEWDNANAWQGFNNYDGRYYPYNGNLEDMNTGSANGIWTLRVEDLGAFGNGILDRVAIQFCDASGQACNVCYADAGYFNPVPTQVFCANDPLLSSGSYFKVINEGASFNNETYNYAVAEGDNILYFGTSTDLSTLPTGDYTICGVINKQEDQEDLNLITSLSALRDVFDNATYCGDMMRNCMDIRIEEPQSQTSEQATICPGEVTMINGLNFYETVDTTIYTYTGGGCESAIRYIITQTELESVIISSTNSIDCNGTLILNGQNSAGSGLSYTWTTDSGNFVNNTGPIATIDEPGLYFLEVSSGNCTDISSIEILPGNDFGNIIELQADSLGCANSVVTINANIQGNYDSFTWSGPGITDPNELNPNVNAPGIYTLTVNNGGSACQSASNSIVIAQSNMAQTPLFNNIPPLECGEFAQLQIVNQIDAAEAAWIDEDGDTLSQNPVALNIPGPGIYTYSYIDGFGCAGSASTTVDANYEPLDYTITIDSLTCNDFEGQIFVNIEPGKVESYFWIAPGSTFFQTQNPEIELPGNYQLVMTGTDGCVTRDTIVVDYDEAAFNHTVSVPEITCAERETEIFVVPAPPNYDYEWARKLDGSFSAPNSSVITVDKGGVYYVTITRPSDGCMVREWTLVNTDTLPADLTFDIEKIDCDTDKILLESNANGFGLMEFTWSGPGITPANESDVFPEVNMIGEYVIEGISGNGCEFMDTVIVEDDFRPINLTQQQTLILDCFDQDKTAVIEIEAGGLTEGEFTWMTPGGMMGGPVTDSRLIIDIDEVGDYVIDVVGVNGCNDQLILDVIYGAAPPEVDLSVPGNLDCVNTEVTITSTFGGDVDSFDWLSHPAEVDQDILITEPGEYIIEVRNNAGCSATDTIMIEDNRRDVMVELMADTITCVNVQAQLFVETMETGTLTYAWEGPQGDLGTDEMITVSDIDSYTVTVTADDGCTGEAVIMIESDTSSLAFEVLPIDVIDCIDTEVTGFINDQTVDYDSIAQVNWIVNGMIVAEETTGILSEGGMYTVEVTSVNGCTSEVMVEVFENKIYPEVTIEPDSINCANSQFDVEAILVVGDNPTYEWDGPDPDVVGLTDASISGIEAGTYTVTVTDTNNCTIEETVEIIGDFEAPSIGVQNAPLFVSCIEPETTVELVNYDPLIHQIEMIDPDGNTIADISQDLTVPGTYNTYTTGENGCIDTLTFDIIPDLEAPEAVIDSTNINCENTEGSLTVLNNFGNIESYEWFAPSGPLSDDVDGIKVTEAGDYEVVITGVNGCTDTLYSSIEIDTITPVLSVDQIGLIGCESKEAVINAIDETGSILSYEWTTSDGLILNGEGQAELLVGEPGTYNLSVQDQINKCVTDLSFTVGDSSSVVDIIPIDFMSPPCEGQAMGQINIGNVTGGYAPLRYSIDGGVSFSDEALFEDLAAGTYDVLVVDSIGCMANEEVILDDGLSIQLDLGQDTTINLGQSYTILPMSNYDPADLILEWETNYPDYECDGCWETEVTPFNTTIYTLTITDEFNCTTSDRIIVQVNDTVQVYIPNIVDTESVTEDALVPFYAGPGVESVSSWMILDRWGNIMHHRENFLPNEIQYAWDGTSNGVKVVPGVYLYIAEVVLINGDIRTKAGDITVIR